MKARADQYNAAIGRQIRAEIAAAGSSISAVARDLGIARSALDNYVTGKRAIPIPIAYQVGEILGVDPQLIVKRATERFWEEEREQRDNVLLGRFGVGGARQARKVANEADERDRGGDDGQG